MAARNIVNFVTNCAPKRLRNPFSQHQIALQNDPEKVLQTAPCRPNVSLDALRNAGCGSIGSVTLEPIVNQRLYQQVADSIRRQIQSGAMAAGSRLPSEKLLAQQLGVSRPTVREAMIALEIAGLVEIRTGSGSYVRHRDSIAAPSVDTGPGPIELLNARILIEGEIAAEAAQRATPEDLEEIAGTLTEMASIIARGEHSRSADQSFHVSIARASGNDVLASIVGELWAGMFSPRALRFTHTGREAPAHSPATRPKVKLSIALIGARPANRAATVSPAFKVSIAR